MPEKTKAYKCKYCKKVYLSYSSAYSHEAKCFYNPKKRACVTCRHYKIHSETVYNRHHNGTPGSTDYEETYLWCTARDKILLKRENNCDYWFNPLTPNKERKLWI